MGLVHYSSRYSSSVRRKMKTVRAAAGGRLTIRELARQVGYSYEHVRKAYRGETHYISAEFNMRLCTVLGLDADAMWRLIRAEKMAAWLDTHEKQARQRARRFNVRQVSDDPVHASISGIEGSELESHEKQARQRVKAFKVRQVSHDLIQANIKGIEGAELERHEKQAQQRVTRFKVRQVTDDRVHANISGIEGSERKALGMDISLRILRVKDVLRILQVSRTTLWRMIQRGHFPLQTNVTNGIKGWPEAQISAWLRAKETGFRFKHRV
jgi:predicted DNA-binding transcriptional regulator AlpA/transcriptional regulator with XRE-family HTH domain